MTGRIIVVGDLVTDVVAVLSGPPAPDTDTAASIRFTGGGQAANTAAWLAWHGAPVTLLAAVGADAAGEARLAELRAAGVTCPLAPRDGAPTGTVIVLAEGGRRTMITDRGASLRLDADEVAAAVAGADGARHLHLSGYPLLDDGSRAAGLRALAAARGRGLTVSVDAASAGPLRQVGGAAFLSWVRGADLLLANADEAAVLAGDRGGDPVHQARTLAADLGATVVVKRAGDGAIWAGSDGVVSVPAPAATVVDPTGAGDAFAAGLLATRLAGGDPRACLTAAAAAGARAVAAVGARP